MLFEFLRDLSILVLATISLSMFCVFRMVFWVHRVLSCGPRKPPMAAFGASLCVLIVVGIALLDGNG